MADGGLLGAGGHSQGPEEAVDQDVELVHILRLSLHHGEHNLVSLPHTFSVRRANVILHDGLPFPSTQPSSHEALNLQKREREGKKKEGRKGNRERGGGRKEGRKKERKKEKKEISGSCKTGFLKSVSKGVHPVPYKTLLSQKVHTFVTQQKNDLKIIILSGLKVSSISLRCLGLSIWVAEYNNI